MPTGAGRDWHLRGHVHMQPARVIQQCDRPHLLRRVGQVPVQPHGKRRAASRHRQPQRPPGQGERARIPAHRHQAPLPPRKSRRLVPARPALGRGEPCVGIAAQYRPGTCGIQFTERTRARCRKLPAQLFIPCQRGVLAAAPPRVDLQYAAPDIAGRPQQPGQPPPLPAGDTQPAPSGAVYHLGRTCGTLPGHAGIVSSPTVKTTQRRASGQPAPTASGTAPWPAWPPATCTGRAADGPGRAHHRDRPVFYSGGASTKTSLGQKPLARDRWHQFTRVDIGFRGKFAYVTGQLPDDRTCRSANSATRDMPAPAPGRYSNELTGRTTSMPRRKFSLYILPVSRGSGRRSWSR